MTDFNQRSAPLTTAQLLTMIKLVDGQGSGLDADVVRGVGLDGSTFQVGGITGVPGFGVAVPRSRFTGCTYPTALLGV